jgi:predicted dehydrogenase
LRLAAVADRVAARCAAAAPGIPSFSDAAELIDAGIADVLVLATPAAAHLADARLAAEAGLPTLVEKPPTPTTRETAELLQLDPAPWIGFNRRFDPGLRSLREAARDVKSIELSLLLCTRRRSWRAYEADDNVLLDLGPHLVDLAFWLSGGKPACVTGRVKRGRASLLIELADNRGVARIDCIGNRPYRERFEVRTRGRTSARYERSGLRSLFGGSTAESPLVPSLVCQLESFANAARGGAEPDLAHASEALTVMQALECAQTPAAGA